jgi:uncharacterized protein YuzE
MRVTCDDRHDLLYLQLDDKAAAVRNVDVADGVVLELTADDRIAGLEILGASKLVNLDRLLPVEYVRAAG